MEALWTYEHHGAVLRIEAYEPARPMQRRAPAPRAPGAGRFEIGPIGLSREGGAYTLTARVAGRNIAYIYAEVLLRDGAPDRYYGPVAREHARADRETEIRGAVHPEWDDPVEVAAGLYPRLRLLADGEEAAFCFASPAGYGSTDHRLEGLYTRAGESAPLRAVLTLAADGETRSIVAQKEGRGRVMPRGLTPRPGDRFAPFVQVLEPAAADGGWVATTAVCNPVTFHGEPFRMVTEAPIPGEYLVGILVEDLDGGLTREYVPSSTG